MGKVIDRVRAREERLKAVLIKRMERDYSDEMRRFKHRNAMMQNATLLRLIAPINQVQEPAPVKPWWRFW